MRIKILILLFLFLFFTSTTEAQTRIAADVTRLGVGARLLGMGKMFTGYADDLSAMFLNPAGLTNLENFQFMSMSGKFVNIVNYLTLAAAAPTEFGGIGIGYASASIGFFTPKLELVEIAPDEYRIIPSTTEVENYEYTDKAVTFSYAFDIPQVKHLSVGTTFKLFSERFTGSFGAYAVGTEMDASMLFSPTPFLSFGITQQNLMPHSLGGGVRWDTGLTEAIPSRTRIGSAARLQTLGDVTVGMDYDFTLMNRYEPGTMHLGIEWWPNQSLALRGGIDQDVVGSETAASGYEYYNNSTLGLSLLFYDFRFDYAYHTYNYLPSNDTHFFSLVYGYKRIMPKIEQLVITPEDKTILRQDYVTLEVYVKDVRVIRQIKIGDETIVTTYPGTYETEVPLKIGKNTILVKGLDFGGRPVESHHIRILRLKTFKDVAEEYWASEPISALGTLGILKGFLDGTFGPDKYMRRVDLMILTVRLKGLTEKIETPSKVLEDPFKDLKADHWAAPYAAAAKPLGIITGYPDGSFKPYRRTTRLEGILMLNRFAGHVEERAIEKPFLDIPGRHWAIAEITSAKYHGLLKYLRGAMGPKEPITRAEIAELISQTPLGREEINKLYDFEIGY